MTEKATAPPGAERSSLVTIDDVDRAERALEGFVRRTPLLPAGELSRRFGAPVALKAENLQLTGSFKVRGAFNKMANLSQDELAAGVVAASAGNHGQAVALVARRLGIRAVIFMPTDAPLTKVDAVRGYGGEVRLIEGSFEEAKETARSIAAREGRTFVHAFDDPDVVAGQGTIGVEIAREARDTRLVVVPLGGGGLASGVAIAAKEKIDGVRVVAVQAESRSEKTICDGIAIKRPGDVTGPLVERYLDEIVTVDDDEAAEAMVLLLERSKLVVEGAGAVGVAALMQGRIERPGDGETCVILSGGNVDASLLEECIRLGETAAGRRIVVRTVVPDRPGALARLLAVVADRGANVLEVEHLREGMELHVRETAIELVLQTRGREHCAEVLHAIEAEGFRARVQH